MTDPGEIEEDVDDPRMSSCKNPGRRGCGVCDRCVEWGDWECHRRQDEELLKGEK